MRTASSIAAAVLLGIVVGAACSGDKGDSSGTTDSGSGTGASGSGASTGSTAGTSGTGGTTAGSGSASSGGTTGSSAGTSAGSGGSASGSTGSGSGTSGGATTGGVTCADGKSWACTNGLDDDMDGLVDLDDPECIGPCDDDEGSFATGIPGDNMDCKQDCFFDGDSGSGNDGCEWSLKCDPANPGANVGCAYTGGNNCNNVEPPSDECKEACEPYVPNGCDCFGCCTVLTDMGEKHIYLGDPGCALDKLENCTECTPQDDVCGNPCDPETCELCFGGMLPPGCTEPECPLGIDNCLMQADCPTGYFCVTGCCYPPPPG